MMPEWELTQRRFEAWWSGEIVDRPLIQVIVPDADVVSGRRPRAKSLEEMWLNADYRIDAYEWELSRTQYFGDAFPFMNTHIGPGTFSLYVGAIPEYQDTTVWYDKCYGDIEMALPPVFDENNVYWRASLDLVRKANARLGDRALVSFPDLIENLDTLAALFGTEEILAALVDYPDQVHTFQRAILPLYLKIFESLYEEISDKDGGSCFTGFCVYGKGRVSKLQCDISAMISRSMFDEFVVPYLIEQCSSIDKTVYHWDGVNAMHHEASLLDLPELNAIQWTPGAGQPGAGCSKWWPMYRRVKAAGKSLLLMDVTPDEVEPLIEEIGPEGLNIVVWCESADVARSIISKSYTWKNRKRYSECIPFSSTSGGAGNQS